MSNVEHVRDRVNQLQQYSYNKPEPQAMNLFWMGEDEKGLLMRGEGGELPNLRYQTKSNFVTISPSSKRLSIASHRVRPSPDEISVQFWEYRSSCLRRCRNRVCAGHRE